jgi:hypothetical protein
MATRLEVLAELERRGKLPPDVRGVFEEARRRGLVPERDLPAEAFPEPEEVIPEFEQPPTLGERVAPLVPELAGGTIGGLVRGGAKRAVPFAGLGAAAGEAVRQIGEQVESTTGLDVPLVSGEEAPTTSAEAAIRIGKAGLRGLTGEIGGRAVVAGISFGINKILAPIRKEVTAEAQRAISFISENTPEPRGFKFIQKFIKPKKAPALRVAEATDDRVLDFLDNISSESLLGGKQIERFKLAREKVLNDVADDIVNQFGQTVDPDLIGNIFVNTLEGNLKPSRVLAETLYNSADDLARGAEISTASLKEFVSPLVTKAEALGGIEARNAGDDLITTVAQLPDTIDFSVAKELRSRLISRIDEFNVINKKAPAIGKAKRLTTLIDQATEEGLRANNPKAVDVWREANKVYREGSQKFDNAFMRKLKKLADPDFGGRPEAVAQEIFKPGRISNIRKAKLAILGDKSASGKRTWEAMQNFFVRDSLAKATNKQGLINGANLENVLFGRTGMGKKAVEEIVGPNASGRLAEFANALKVTQSKQGAGTGRVFIQLAQAAALPGLFFDRTRGGSALIIFGPLALSKAFTNPTLTNALIGGIKLGAKSKGGASLLNRFVLGLQKEGIETQIRENVESIGAALGGEDELQP